MTRREEERERFADLCYEAWHRGRQEPDGDDFDRELASGKYPDEIRLADIRPQRKPHSDNIED